MRNFIDLVETILMEAQGTFGFYQPSTGKEIETPRGGHVDHADYVVEHPEAFGLKPEQVRPCPDEKDAADYSRMHWMADMIDLTLALGWVRINQFRGAWYFQARDEKLVRRAVKFYDYAYDGVEEAVCDIGLSSAHPDVCFTVYPYEKVQAFIKTGARPR